MAKKIKSLPIVLPITANLRIEPNDVRQVLESILTIEYQDQDLEPGVKNYAWGYLADTGNFADLLQALPEDQLTKVARLLFPANLSDDLFKATCTSVHYEGFGDMAEDLAFPKETVEAVIAYVWPLLDAKVNEYIAEEGERKSKAERARDQRRQEEIRRDLLALGWTWVNGTLIPPKEFKVPADKKPKVGKGAPLTTGASWPLPAAKAKAKKK